MTSDQPAIDVLVFGSMFYAGHQLTDQRVTQALRTAGQQIVYVEPAANVLMSARHQTQGRSQRLGLTVCDDGTTVFTPATLPLGRRPGVAILSNALIALQVLGVLRRRLTRDTVVLFFSTHPTLLLFLRRWMLVVVVKDDYPAGAELVGRSARSIARRRRGALNRADRVATVSHVLRASLLRQGVVATVIPAGVDVPKYQFAEPADLTAIPHPRALFSGMTSDRVDITLLEAVVDAGWQLVMIGGQQPTFTGAVRLARLRRRPGVHSLGWRSPAEVQAATQWCDVGLVPYVLSPFNLASSPLKTLEYLGGGLPVMSTALPAVLDLGSPDITIVTSPSDLRQQLERLANAPLDAAARLRRVGLARANSWEQRATAYLNLLRA